MMRLVVVILLALILSACSGDPRERLLPETLTEWETDGDFQDAIAELTLEEQDLLATYLMRMEANRLAGEPMPARMTIREAVKDQLQFVAQWQERKQAEKDEARAAAMQIRNYLARVEVVGFNVVEQASPGGGGPQRVFCGSIINKGNRPLSDVQLTIYFLDKYGHEVSEVNYRPVQEQEAGAGGSNCLLPEAQIRFNYPAPEDAPADWPGMASAMVTNIAFAQDAAGITN